MTKIVKIVYGRSFQLNPRSFDKAWVGFEVEVNEESQPYEEVMGKLREYADHEERKERIHYAKSR